jgi:hypothetical protein
VVFEVVTRADFAGSQRRTGGEFWILDFGFLIGDSGRHENPEIDEFEERGSYLSGWWVFRA